MAADSCTSFCAGLDVALGDLSLGHRMVYANDGQHPERPWTPRKKQPRAGDRA